MNKFICFKQQKRQVYNLPVLINVFKLIFFASYLRNLKYQ
nr:MAG TPA: hypothetical protein [Bacteriophage sp.]